MLPDMDGIRIPKPRAPQYLQVKRMDERFLAVNQETAEAPPLAQVDRIYLLVWHKGKPVVVRYGEPSAPWELPVIERAAGADGERAGKGKAATPPEALERWLKQSAKALWGIQIGGWYQHSRLELTASALQSEVEPGSVRYWVFACATASRLGEAPAGRDVTRRAMDTRDYARLLREQYAEFDEILDAAHDGYLIRAARGEV